MADFEPAAQFLRESEGGLADHPSDPGGITHHGVSLRFLRRLGNLRLGDIDNDGDIDSDDIRQMSWEHAAAIYRSQWWDRYQYHLLTSQRLATKLLDTAVNVGAYQAHKMLQRALRQRGSDLAVDGVLGPLTRRDANLAGDCAVEPLKQQQEAFYIELVDTKPRYEPFLSGWIRRARRG